MNTPDQIPSITVAEQEACAVITLNRPERRNCLALAVLDDLEGALLRLRRRSDLRGLIVAGAGGVFSAGADLSEIAQLTPESALTFARRGQAVFALLDATSPVTVAAIDGPCLGGGLDLALACRWRVATPRSSFQHPGARRGIMTGWGGTVKLPRLIGRGAATRLLLTGERIDARQAQIIGLVNLLADEVVEAARELAWTKFQGR